MLLDDKLWDIIKYARFDQRKVVVDDCDIFK